MQKETTEEIIEPTITVYRAQDIYGTFQRIEVEEGVSIQLTDPPLNISLHRRAKSHAKSRSSSAVWA